jgi:hypothetical protein
MTRVNRASVGGGESLPATAAIRLELLLVPGSAANQSSQRHESTAEQSQANFHRGHPFDGVAECERPRARESTEYITGGEDCQDKSQPM